MTLKRKNSWQYDARYGQPVVKDGCGIFGVIRKKNAPKISNLTAVSGISCITYRGSNLGAGYASFDASDGARGYKIRAFVRDRTVARSLEEELRKVLGPIEDVELKIQDGRFGTLQARLLTENSSESVERAVDRINSKLLSNQRIDGRIYSYGRHVDVYKEVGYPLEVAKMCGLDSDAKKADLWIAHTRQPTNSPGAFPIWSHPFASLDCAIVHNGDISSFGANIDLLSSWGLQSHVGTDSEVIARLLDHLIRVEGLTVVEAATVLTNPYERNLSQQALNLLVKYKGARLDGPFAVVAGYVDANDTYMIALTDRSKFRPILVGEDENCYYVASEENQIRNLSRDAKIWTPDPGSFFVASLERGLICSGTSRNLDLQETVLIRSFPQSTSDNLPTLDSTGLGFREINERISQSFNAGEAGIRIQNLNGQRYLGIGISTKQGNAKKKFAITLEGFPGNCLANLNDGATFEVYGNVADDLSDTMHDGEVIVHGNARDVVGQALQGGCIFVRGAVGNRAAIQMREYQKARPYLLVGETADDYLGEYMAGGVVALLNLSSSERPVGGYVGTGMVGGVIYIRGKVKETQIGLLPQREDILNYLRAALVDGMISQEIYDSVSGSGFPSEAALEALLPKELFNRIRFLFFGGKYTKPMVVEYRKLAPADLEVLYDKLTEFFRVFDLPDSKLQEVLHSEFTIIRTKEEKVETPVPPQEVPVEE